MQDAPLKVRASSDAEEVAVDLFASRPLVSTYHGGALVIDAATPDFVKYIDGGMRNDWERGVRVADAAAAGGQRVVSLVRGLGAQLYFPFDEDPGGIEITGETLKIRFIAKSFVDKQLASVFLNEHKLGDVSLPTKEWQSYSVSAPRDAVQIGENKLRFYFRSSAEVEGQRSAAAFAKFVIGDSPGDEPVFNVVQVTAEGRLQRALEVVADSRLSYSLRVPSSATEINFDVAGVSPFAISIRAETQPMRELVAGVAVAGWTSHVVDLAPFRGQVVRLDFRNTASLAWAKPRILQAQPPVAKRERKPPQRVLLLSISSLRLDRLRLEVGRNMRRFVEQGFSVPNFQASVAQASAAHASIMSGRLTTEGRIADEVVTMAEAVRRLGYATALISGNGFVSDEAGFVQGFTYYDNPMRRHHHAGAKTLWRQAKKFLLAHRKERAFVHIAMVEPHLPYRPTDESLAREWSGTPLFSGAKTLALSEQIASGRRAPTLPEQNFVRALYDASVADVDGAFAEILTELVDMDLDGETAIILAGDHGEELWERGRFGHTGSLKQEVLQTPFAIQYSELSDLPPPTIASSADIKATILDLVGAPIDATGQGMSMLSGDPALSERPHFAGTRDGSRSLRLGDYKLIIPAAGEGELYDLRSDPGERNNRIADLPVVLRALRNTLATGVAYAEVWSSSRWGQASSPFESFARDQGM